MENLNNENQTDSIGDIGKIFLKKYEYEIIKEKFDEFTHKLVIRDLNNNVKRYLSRNIE